MKSKSLILYIVISNAVTFCGSYAMEVNYSNLQLVLAEGEWHYNNILNSLFIAIDANEFEKVKTLMGRFMPLDVKNHRGQTPLMLAAYKGYIDIVSLFFGFDWKEIEPTLHIEALVDFSELCGINMQDNYGNTALILAANKGYESIVEKLLEKGAEVSIANCCGDTALILAAHKGHESVVKKLLESGSNALTANCCGDTAIERAKRSDHNNIVKLLKQYEDNELSSSYTE